MCLAAAFRCCNEKDQLGVTVGAVEVNRVGQPGKRKRGFGDSGTTAVRDSDPSVHAGAGLSLTRDGCLSHRCGISRTARICDTCSELANDIGGRNAKVSIKRDKFWRDERLIHVVFFHAVIRGTRECVQGRYRKERGCQCPAATPQPSRTPLHGGGTRLVHPRRSVPSGSQPTNYHQRRRLRAP